MSLESFGINSDMNLEIAFARQNKEQLVSLMSQLLEAITLQELDRYEDQGVFYFDQLEAMTPQERRQWLKASATRLEELANEL